MAEGINNNFTQKINQESLVRSISEQETQMLPLFAEEILEEETNSDKNEFSTTSEVDLLYAEMEKVSKEQGLISSLWNGLKCATNIGSSTEKCEKAIEKFQNGEITFEEVAQTISDFQTKQKNSVNIFANVLTGLTAVAVVGSAVATGGLSLGVIALGAGVGAGTKAGLKFLDRATNKVKGDAADAKQIAKDALSGATDGAISVATLGIGTTAIAGKTVAEQTVKQTIIQGAKLGAIDGAISGAVTGASDYAIEAALEEDVEFSGKEMLKTATINGAVGGVLGGVIGGTSAKIKHQKAVKAQNTAETQNVVKTQKPIEAENIAETQNIVEPKNTVELQNPAEVQLQNNSLEMTATYNSHIKEATEQIETAFNDVDSVSEITGRAKSQESTLDKLSSKFSKKELTSTDMDECYSVVADAYGTRIQMKNLTAAEADEIINKVAKENKITYDDFMKYITNDLDNYSEFDANQIAIASEHILDALKTKQTSEVVDQLIAKIKSGDVTITELNNYGDQISSYFTDSQLKSISDAYFEKTGHKLDIVTRFDFTQGGSKVEDGLNVEYKSNIKTEGAIKKSGYSTTQMNTKHTFADGTEGLGELQIRGQELNEFADAEHIPYDIRKGKITETNTKYSDVYSIYKTMSDESYELYNTYLNDVYKWTRLKELGIELPEPQMPTNLVTEDGIALTQESLALISREGLINHPH